MDDLVKVIRYWIEIVIPFSFKESVKGFFKDFWSLIKKSLLYILLPSLVGKRIIDSNYALPLLGSLKTGYQIGILLIIFDVLIIIIRTIFISPSKIYWNQEKEIQKKYKINLDHEGYLHGDKRQVSIKVSNLECDRQIICEAFLEKAYRNDFDESRSKWIDVTQKINETGSPYIWDEDINKIESVIKPNRFSLINLAKLKENSTYLLFPFKKSTSTANCTKYKVCVSIHCSIDKNLAPIIIKHYLVFTTEFTEKRKRYELRYRDFQNESEWLKEETIN